MNKLQIFNYQPQDGREVRTVRTVQINGEPWFVLKDVCQILGLGTPSRVAERLDPDEVSQTHITDSLGRKQEMTVINESGLYHVILRSDKPEAKPFRKWVTSEVLPSIRQHGMYATGVTVERMLEDPDSMIRVLQALKDERSKNQQLKAENSTLVVENAIMAPKADYFDQLVDRNTLTNFRETAKQLNVPPRAFVQFLLDKKYLYRDKKGHLMPYEEKNTGLFQVKESMNQKTQWSGTQTLVTPKGRETFRLLYL